MEVNIEAGTTKTDTKRTHHKMRIPERDDLLSVYLYTLIHRLVDIYG